VLHKYEHPSYSNSHKRYDVALLELASSVPHSEVDFLQLYDFTDPLPDGTAAYIAGWGRTDRDDEYSGSDQLKGLSMAISEDCDYVPIFYVLDLGYSWQPDRFVCAGAWPDSTCQGDSGSSLVVNRAGVLFSAGIVSFGLECGLYSDMPTVFTRTADVASWVRSYVGSPVKTTTSSSSSHSPTIWLSGVSRSDSYLVEITAHSSNGNSETFLSRLTASVGTPTVVRSVSVLPSGRSASVSWIRPWLSGGDSSYTYRAIASPGGRSCTTTGTSCTITGLDPLTSYSVSVTATNRAGRGPAGSATFTTSDSIVRSADEIGVDCNDAQPHPFADIPSTHYSYGPAGCIYQLGVTTGTGSSTYAPGNAVTRAQMAAFLARFYTIVTGLECQGNTPFVDVPSGAYYTEAVGCIYQLGITTGTSATTYAPGMVVTRAQMAAFLARLYSTLTETTCTGTHPFEDVPLTAYFSGPAGCIFNLGITTGTSATTYSPNNIVTRDQMAAFLARTYVSLTAN